MNLESQNSGRWYDGVTRYQWLVLIIASLGWIFDIFEGHVFVTSMGEAMPALLPPGSTKGTIDAYNNFAMGAFLVGGALGGVVFGMLSDRIGRVRTLILTILTYSIFSCVTAFSQAPWQMIVLRFLVALGTGGEWSVGAALVAEVFSKRARAHSLGLFHGSSVIGTYLAVLVGTFIVSNPQLRLFGISAPGWRWGFAVGLLPALLTVWIMTSLREPERWVQARGAAVKDRQQPGRLRDLFAPGILRNTLVGLSLATIGLAIYWGVYIYGWALLRQWAERAQLPPQSVKRWEMLGMFLVVTGGGLGLISFGPICERIGRRGAFLLFHLGGLIAALVLFQLLARAPALVLCIALPVFGYLVIAIHAGYAIYFPELFPTRLRGTGGGFCFNGGRFLAASLLLVRAWMRSDGAVGWGPLRVPGLGLTLEATATILSLLFLLGVLVLLFAPETKGKELPT
ncbi:MAG: MFS transporter [Candidatus Sumerlaeia bacterium]|nr:MFS transporter [Candidatus Sumerlaeia bacterium]